MPVSPPKSVVPRTSSSFCRPTRGAGATAFEFAVESHRAEKDAKRLKKEGVTSATYYGAALGFRGYRRAIATHLRLEDKVRADLAPLAEGAADGTLSSSERRRAGRLLAMLNDALNTDFRSASATESKLGISPTRTPGGAGRIGNAIAQYGKSARRLSMTSRLRVLSAETLNDAIPLNQTDKFVKQAKAILKRVALDKKTASDLNLPESVRYAAANRWRVDDQLRVTAIVTQIDKQLGYKGFGPHIPKYGIAQAKLAALPKGDPLRNAYAKQIRTLSPLWEESLTKGVIAHDVHAID